jgi:hypothetical protein
MSSEDKFMREFTESMDNQEADEPFPDFNLHAKDYLEEKQMMLPYKKKRLKGHRDSSRIPNFSSLKEYVVLSNYTVRDQHTFLDVVSKALQGDTWEFLNLETAQQSINEVFYYLALVKRFRQLSMLGAELTVSDEGFHLGESTFETLNDVAKAIKNKAFL